MGNIGKAEGGQDWLHLEDLVESLAGAAAEADKRLSGMALTQFNVEFSVDLDVVEQAEEGERRAPDWASRALRADEKATHVRRRPDGGLGWLQSRVRLSPPGHAGSGGKMHVATDDDTVREPGERPQERARITLQFRRVLGDELED